MRQIHPTYNPAGKGKHHEQKCTGEREKSVRILYLVPSANRICTLVVGNVWSTSNIVFIRGRSAPPLALVLALAESRNEPGMATTGAPEASGATAGDPRRLPAPLNAAARRLGAGV